MKKHTFIIEKNYIYARISYKEGVRQFGAKYITGGNPVW